MYMTEPKQLKTLNTMSMEKYSMLKKQKQIKNWYKQYGVVVETDEQYNFFKLNRSIIVKALPLYKDINKHFPSFLDDGLITH